MLSIRCHIRILTDMSLEDDQVLCCVGHTTLGGVASQILDALADTFLKIFIDFWRFVVAMFSLVRQISRRGRYAFGQDHDLCNKIVLAFTVSACFEFEPVSQIINLGT